MLAGKHSICTTVKSAWRSTLGWAWMSLAKEPRLRFSAGRRIIPKRSRRVNGRTSDNHRCSGLVGRESLARVKVRVAAKIRKLVHIVLYSGCVWRESYAQYKLRNVLGGAEHPVYAYRALCSPSMWHHDNSRNSFVIWSAICYNIYRFEC